ncbi:UNVERIFIED_CONTAM: sec-independent protein translocase protein TatB [Williamsia faeni]
MFSSVGWGEILILMIAGLVILGPERLPDAVKWTLKSVREVRDYATGATSQLKEDLGADFEDLRKPLADLNELRGMSPRKAITKHLLDGDDSFFTGNFDSGTKIKPVSQPLPTTDENARVISAAAPDKPAAPSLSKTVTPPPPSGVIDVDRWDAT